MFPASISPHRFLICGAALGVLVFAGCSISPDRAARTSPSQEASVSSGDISAKSTASASGLREIPARDERARADADAYLHAPSREWVRRSMAFLGSALSRAAQREMLVTSEPAASSAELAPYLFVWPLSYPEDQQYQLAEPAEVQAQALHTWEDVSSQPPLFSLACRGTDLVLQQPAFDPASGELLPAFEHSKTMLPPYMRVTTPSGQPTFPPLYEVPEKLRAAASDPEESQRLLTGYRFQAASPGDARVAQALQEMHYALSTAVQGTGTLPTSVQELERYSGRTFINFAEAATDAEATLLLQWDGVQSYRIRAVYPSGLVDDSVLVITELGPGVWDGDYWTSIRFAQLGRTLTTLGRWDLVARDAARIPGSGIGGVERPASADRVTTED